MCSGHEISHITRITGGIIYQTTSLYPLHTTGFFVCPQTPVYTRQRERASLGYLSDKARSAEPTQKSPPSLSVINSSRVLTVSRKNSGGIQTAEAVVIYILPSAGLNCTGLLPVGDMTVNHTADGR